MGGCASRPKDLDTAQEPLPAEDATTPKAEGETVPEENGGEKEEPLVDLSEPAEEAATEAEAGSEDPKEEEAAADETKEEEVKDGEEKAAASEDKSDAPLVTV